MSGADSLLFKEENVPGKGVGCVAMKNIKKGTLVLRETPQLYFPEQKEGSSLDAYRENAEAVIEGFTRMSRDDQRKYLELCNNFEGDRGNWSPGMNIDFDAVMKATNNITFPTLCKGKALKVWSIYKTNGFPNGVFLKMSRFNHSCRPNAEWLWNEETKTQDVRVLRKVKEGEEITLAYTWKWAREERRAELENYFNFNCRCEACDITEEEILEEKEIT